MCSNSLQCERDTSNDDVLYNIIYILYCISRRIAAEAFYRGRAVFQDGFLPTESPIDRCVLRDERSPPLFADITANERQLVESRLYIFSRIVGSIDILPMTRPMVSAVQSGPY